MDSGGRPETGSSHRNPWSKKVEVHRNQSRSCRLRWLNYLRPNIKRGNISDQEEDLILRLHKLLGNRWSLIAGRLPGRTDNEIKNYWNCHLSNKINSRQQNRGLETESKVIRAPEQDSVNNKEQGTLRFRNTQCLTFLETTTMISFVVLMKSH